MAVGDIIVRIGGDVSALQKSLKDAEWSMRRAGRNMKRIGGELTMGLTVPIAGVGAASLVTAAKFEKLRISMQTLVGSAEEGNRVFERLQKFSAGTPFQLEDLARANNTLMGFGMNADEAYVALQQLGDIAAISGGDLQGIGVAFGQAAAEGRVMTRDIRQFINQGVPMIKMLADTMGVAESEILDLASQGEISFEILQQAFRDATSEGGMFADGMEKQSKTLFGLWSTLKDNVSIAMAEVGMAIKEAFNLSELIPNVIDKIKGLTSWFQKLTPEAKRMTVIIAAIAAAIGPVIFIVGQLTIAIGALSGALALLTSPVTVVVAALGALAAAVLYVWDNWAAIKERISDIGWWRNTLIEMVKFLLKYNPIQLLIKPFEALLNMLGVEIPNPFDQVADQLDKLKVKTKDYQHEFGSFGRALKNGIKAGAEAMGLLGEETKSAEKAMKELDKSTTSAAGGMTAVGGSGGVGGGSGGGSDKKRGGGMAFLQDMGKSAFGEAVKGSEKLQEKLMGLKSTVDGSLKPVLDSTAEGFKKTAQTAGEKWEIVLDDIKEGLQSTVDFIQDKLGGAISSVFDIWGQSLENKEARQQQAYEAELERIESSTMSEKAKQEAISELNKKREKEEKKMAREKAKREKAMAIFQAVIQTAAAVTKVIANPILAGIVAALGAIQIGVIASEPLPALADGAMAFGPTQAIVGDNVGARTDPEVISPLSKLKQYIGGGQQVKLTGQFRVDGQDLIYVIDENRQIRERR